LCLDGNRFIQLCIPNVLLIYLTDEFSVSCRSFSKLPDTLYIRECLSLNCQTQTPEIKVYIEGNGKTAERQVMT